MLRFLRHRLVKNRRYFRPYYAGYRRHRGFRRRDANMPLPYISASCYASMPPHVRIVNIFLFRHFQCAFSIHEKVRAAVSLGLAIGADAYTRWLQSGRLEIRCKGFFQTITYHHRASRTSDDTMLIIVSRGFTAISHDIHISPLRYRHWRH